MSSLPALASCRVLPELTLRQGFEGKGFFLVGGDDPRSAVRRIQGGRKGRRATTKQGTALGKSGAL